MKPFVSVLTPTYNRRKFIPAAIAMYKAQTYPKDRMEWIIVDDGTDKVEDLFKEASKTIPNIKYISLDTKLLIGQKRNLLNDNSKGDIMVAMDDDDYYPPDRVSHAVIKFIQNPKVMLAGSSEMYLYFRVDGKILKAGPYNPNHCTNGTMCYRRAYMLSHRYDETQTHAEEKSFLDDYKNPMIQLDPFKCILVMCHADNTFDKNNLRNSNNPLLVETSMKISGFIRDKTLRDFFVSC
uniref:Glycosyltransferase 2-like domain-containing protein n=1 Tax=viral metagenome TaxID=1070528 RepID=A0A6C0DH51_9ZZZZ